MKENFQILKDEAEIFKSNFTVNIGKYRAVKFCQETTVYILTLEFQIASKIRVNGLGVWTLCFRV